MLSSATLDPTSSDFLDRPVCQLMTPGVVSLPETATVRMAFGALVAHRVHAVLIVARDGGRPLGWVSARGLLAFLLRDDDLLHVGQAIDQAAATISPNARSAMRSNSSPNPTPLISSSRAAPATTPKESSARST